MGKNTLEGRREGRKGWRGEGGGREGEGGNNIMEDRKSEEARYL